jgi:signal transduction histidine kinase
VGQALRTGQVTVLGEVPEPVSKALGLLERCARRPPRSAMVVPMLARGHTLGALTFVTCNPERRDGPESPLAKELAAMAALAVDNARLYRTREQILEVVSHDLRTPLTTMLGNVSLIQDMKAPPQGPLEVIFRAAGHMSRLVEDLLDMSRLEVGTFVLEREQVELGPLLDELVQMMRSTAEIRGLKLQAYAAPDLPEVHADRRRVMQVLWNLVGNALKFTPAGGTVEVQARASGQDIRLEVVDSGPGIPERQMPHVFERFWQGGASNQQGVGLGLSIAKAIVQAHGGRIGVVNARPGATFFFTIPRAAAVS